jgi:hypothetical protein
LSFRSFLRQHSENPRYARRAEQPLSVEIGHSVADGVPDKSGDVVNVETIHDLRAVGFDGLDTDAQGPGYGLSAAIATGRTSAVTLSNAMTRRGKKSIDGEFKERLSQSAINSKIRGSLVIPGIRIPAALVNPSLQANSLVVITPFSELLNHPISVCG